jgi:hypothetical protein
MLFMVLNFESYKRLYIFFLAWTSNLTKMFSISKVFILNFTSNPIFSSLYTPAILLN